MAYSVNNPPRMAVQAMAETRAVQWHMDGNDTAALVRVNGYITNARELGIKPGHRIAYEQVNVTPVVLTNFLVLSINANGSADLNDGVATSNTNTD